MILKPLGVGMLFSACDVLSQGAFCGDKWILRIWVLIALIAAWHFSWMRAIASHFKIQLRHKVCVHAKAAT